MRNVGSLQDREASTAQKEDEMRKRDENLEILQAGYHSISRSMKSSAAAAASLFADDDDDDDADFSRKLL
ncbi:hypothetical protein X798_03710 [Onchocerca flexuosa]|uniref:Uncharacterized protein n=1 Tax=Onchocerca flexuosa TaxID=387005 RepID=A0A238BW79_9BILA|nr:hypothetical protein X798_03710 [Onchocerca flexuosa]